MTDLITGNQIDIAAFDSGMSNDNKRKQLRGTQFADWVEDRGRDAVGYLQRASQEQEGIGDDILRGAASTGKFIQSLAPTTPEEMGQELVDMYSSARIAKGNPWGTAAVHAGKKLIQNSPEVAKAVKVATDVASPYIKKGKEFLEKDWFENLPGYQGRQLATAGVPNMSIGKVDEFKPSNVFASSSDSLYDASNVKVNRVGGGYKGKGHLGLANIMYEGNKGLKQKFNKLRALQQQGPLKHHHIEDVAFTGQWANTSDFEEVFTELNKRKIYPGDSPTNIIGMMDEGNMFLQTGKTDLIRELKRTNFPGLEGINKYHDLTRKNAPAELRRIIDDLFKSPEYGDEFFQGSIDRLGRKTPNQIEPMFATLPDGKRVSPTLPKDKISYPTWRALGLEVNTKQFLNLPKKQQDLLKQQAWSKRWKTLGINRKNIKYDPTKMILSKDHIDTIHYSVYNSPKFTQKRELLKMIEDGSYYKLNPQQKAEKIAEVYKIQKNTSINVAKRRLKSIKNYLKNAEPIRYRDIYSKDPTKLRQWIIDNPSISANLGWKDGIPDYKTLTNPKTASKITDEFRTVFSTGVRELPDISTITNTQVDVKLFDGALK